MRLFLILLLFCATLTAWAQVPQLAPAGVSDNLRLWLRADALGINPADGGDVTTWIDVSQISKAVYSSTSSSGSVWQKAPKYKAQSWNMNFYPAVSFDRVAGGNGYQQYLSSLNGIMTNRAPDEFTVFVVANIDFNRTPDTDGQVAHFMGFGRDFLAGNNDDGNSGDNIERAPAFGVTGANRGKRGSNGKGRYVSANGGGGANAFDGKRELFTSGSTTIAVHQVRKNEYIQYEADGRIEKITAKPNTIMTQNIINMSGPSMIGTGGRVSRNVIGDIAEIIIYEGFLDEADKHKVYTYLALKYGITLDLGESISKIEGFDYKLGDHDIWKAHLVQQYRDYHRNVAALFTDRNSAIVNNKSRSTEAGNFITIGLKDPDEILKDQTAIIWGHNGGALKKNVVPADKCVPYQYSFDRVWMLDRLLTLNIDREEKELVLKTSTEYSDVFPFEGQGWDTYLLIAKDEANAKKANWDRVIPATIRYDDANRIWEQVFYFKLERDTGRMFFSFGGTEKEKACVACTFAGEDKLLIQTNNIDKGDNISLLSGQSQTLGNVPSVNKEILTDITFKANSRSALSVDIPAAYRVNNPVRLNASGDAGVKSTVTYVFTKPSNVEFVIGDINNKEVVEVYGYCAINGSLIRPMETMKFPLEGSALQKGHSYEITSAGQMTGKDVWIGRDDPRGKASVRFDKAVKIVMVEYTSTVKASRSIDLYPISFSCPPQLPSANEAGYVLQKRGPQKLDICETADYTFTILNSNVDCGRKPVHFHDQLPEGMYWIPNSLVIDNENVVAGSLVMEGQLLDMDLLVRGSGNKTIFRAQAAFTDEALAGAYSNQSFITYTRKDNGREEMLGSTDAYYIKGDRQTKTVVAGAKAYKSVATSMEFQPSACFIPNQEVVVKVKVRNPNAQIRSDANNKLYFETYFNKNCTYKPGSLTINGRPVSDTASGVIIGKGEENGLITLKGLSDLILPAKGDTEIAYIIQAPKTDDLTVGYILSVETGDKCLQNAFLSAQGEYTIGHCSWKGAVISNRMIPSRLK
jgi:hypothetical protein